MARFFGKIGFVKTEETDPENHPGVWRPIIKEREYYGDVIRNSRRWDQNGTGVNDNLVLNHTVSIVADDYADRNLGAMKYVVWRGERWQISTIEVQRPRIILSLGGVYNGPEPNTD